MSVSQPIRPAIMFFFGLGLVCVSFVSSAQSIFTHTHMRVPDTEAAAQWHLAVIGGEPGPGGPGPGIHYHNGFIGTMPNEGDLAPASSGSVIDHFGIAVDDVPATVARVEEMGGIIRTAPREGVTAPVIAFVEDPWGVRMELLEDSEYGGVNHIHMMSSNPDAMRDWFLEVFGGEYIEARGKGIFHTILYDNLWVHVSESPDGKRAPSRGRAIDHMGFSVPSLDEFHDVLAGVGIEPYLRRPNPPGSDLMFFIGIEGIHFEIAERR